MNIAIQTYNGVKDNIGSLTYVHIAIELIKSGPELKNKIERLRSITNKDEYEAFKKSLEAVTWSGTFEKRKSELLINYSGLICIDIDDLSTDILKTIKERLKLDPYTFFVFTSPSGNGLKVIIKSSDGPNLHVVNFLYIENYFLLEYNVKIDPSGKDVSRLCFLSYDTDCYSNFDSIPFDRRKHPVTSPVFKKPYTKSEEKKFINADNDLDWIKQFTDKKLTYSEGSRNNYIHLFACNCNRKGIDLNDCFNYVTGFAGDMDIKEVSATIKSAYDHNVHEAGKFAKRQTPSRKNNNSPAKTVKPDSGGTVPVKEDDFIKFWWYTEDEKRTDQEGNPLKRYQVIYNKLIDFLEAGGFFRLRLMNNTYQYIRFHNNVCEPVALINMKDFVFDWLRSRQYQAVLEMMRRGAKSYFIPAIMEGLQYKEIEFGKDTATEAFFYFKNCAVCVTKDGITTLPYTQSQSAIWESSKIQRDFKPVNLKLPMFPEKEGNPGTFEKCEMAKYILLVSHSPESKEEITEEESSKRFLSICSSIGYMLHAYKSRIGKAIIAVDHKIPEDKSEQNGGTGKSIVGESLKYLKSTTIIDGREFKEDYPFRFEMIGVDSKIVVMQDCRYNLDFGSFFVPITNDFTYNRRHTGYITMPFADSPKWWFDTNFVFKGEGASFRRRMHVIEFDDYFTESHTPYDEFGHFLFNDWDDAQWNLFYNFYLWCVQLYLHEGLISYPKSNYENRKLMVESPQEFIDYIDAMDIDGKYKIERNKWFEKKELLRLWGEEAGAFNLQKTTPHMLTKWMKKYCHARPFQLYKDKTNGVEYWLLADDKYKGTGKKSEQPDPPAGPSLFDKMKSKT